MTFKIFHKFIICALAISALSACGSMRAELGLDRHSPDEFAVVKRAPLSLPPEYNMRPPGEMQKQNEPSIQTQKAKETVFGNLDPDDSQTEQTAENVLLGKIGAKTAQDDIRRTLDRESGFVALEDKNVVKKILDWPTKHLKSKEEVINPQEETERLEKEQIDALEEMPVIERRETTFEKLF